VKAPAINPELLLYGAAAVAILFLTYKTTKAASSAADTVTHGIQSAWSTAGDAANAVGNVAGSTWDWVSSKFAQDAKWADITQSQYTPGQVQRIAPAETYAPYQSGAPSFSDWVNSNYLDAVSPSTYVGRPGLTVGPTADNRAFYMPNSNPINSTW
jgi:hypothetical protein